MELLTWLRDMGLLVPHTVAKVLVVAFVVLYTVFKGAVSRFIGSTLKHLKTDWNQSQNPALLQNLDQKVLVFDFR